MLLDNIKRYNATGFFKLVNVDQYLSKGIKLPPQVHSVPTLLFQESRTCIVGKQVFDYLLLPGKGFLMNLPKASPGSTNPNDNSMNNTNEPMSFSLTAKNNMSSDAYSFIENEETHDVHKTYNWSGINDHQSIPTVAEETEPGSLNTETRVKKTLPDISSIQSAREQELQAYVTANPMVGAPAPGISAR